MQSSRRCRTNETANSAAEIRRNARNKKVPVYSALRCRDATTPQSCRLASAPFLFQQPTIPLQRPQPFDTSAVTSSFEPKLKRAATLHFSHTKMFFQIRPVSSPAMADSTLPPISATAPLHRCRRPMSALTNVWNDRMGAARFRYNPSCPRKVVTTNEGGRRTCSQ